MERSGLTYGKEENRFWKHQQKGLSWTAEKTTWIAYPNNADVTYGLDRTQRNSWSGWTDVWNHSDA